MFLAGAPAVSADPLGKVSELMDSLTAKITAEGEAEAKAFKDYVEWCDNAAANLRFEIKTGETKQEELGATISKCKADISACDAKIEDSASISADDKELQQATEVRNKERATFEASQGELVDAIDTLDRAVGILQREMAKNPAALMQVDTKNLDSVIKGLGAVINAASFSSNDQSKPMALVQQQSGSDDEELGAPAAAVNFCNNERGPDLLCVTNTTTTTVTTQTLTTTNGTSKSNTSTPTNTTTTTDTLTTSNTTTTATSTSTNIPTTLTTFTTSSTNTSSHNAYIIMASTTTTTTTTTRTSPTTISAN